MSGYAAMWPAEHICGRKCIFGNIAPINTMAFRGNESVLVSIAAIKAISEALWPRKEMKSPCLVEARGLRNSIQ